MNQFACATYNPDHGDRIRVVLEYEGEFRPILWFELEKDGSIYLGPRKINITEIRHGVAKPIGNGRLLVAGADGVLETDPKIIQKAKLSFHGSGLINEPWRRTTREPIKGLAQQQFLCLVYFQHPREYSAITKKSIKKRDVCLRYPVSERRPIWAYLFIAPSGRSRPVSVEGAEFQTNLIFEYENKGDFPALIVQAVLWHGEECPWPSYTYMAFGGKS